MRTFVEEILAANPTHRICKDEEEARRMVERWQLATKLVKERPNGDFELIELINWLLTFREDAERHPNPSLAAQSARVEELQADKERLDWLCDRCYFPSDVPLTDISLAVDEGSLPHGSITLNVEKDKVTIRAAIDVARAARLNPPSP